jgi:hypothetical protein
MLLILASIVLSVLYYYRVYLCTLVNIVVYTSIYSMAVQCSVNSTMI